MVNHVWGLLAHPSTEFEHIKSENESVSHLYTHHVLLLALIPVICAFIGTTQLGWLSGEGHAIRLDMFTASYTAVTEVNTLNIDKSYILNELCRYEVFNLNYMNMLSNRSQVIYNKLWNSHIGKTRDKIINFLLLRCMTPYGAKKLSIRMEDLARLIDDTRINVSNVLNDLQNRGLIQLGRRTFSIPELREVVQLLDKKD